MARINFRAYLEKEDLLDDVLEIDIKNREIVTKHYGRWPLYESELLNSTTKYDKTGKEIFEGDIVRHESGRYALVIFGYNRNRLEFLFTNSETLMPHSAEKYEVMGNRFKNKDLLERFRWVL